MEHSIKDIYEMHVIVRGKVQGIGFRALTRNYASTLGLKGTVKNLPDGNVEIYAQGSKKTLEELMENLKNDLGPGYIEEASVDYLPLENPHDDFRIIY